MTELVSAHVLADGLAGRTDSLHVRGALGAFLAEAGPSDLLDLVACGAADLRRLKALANDLLPDGHPTREFLDGLA
jgi:hypothetical protein